MPAITSTANTLFEWKALLVQTAARAYRGMYRGESSLKSAKEAAHAFERFRGHALIEELAASSQFDFGFLNPATAEQDLRAYAAREKIDVEVMIEGAAKHFGSPQIVHRTSPFSQEELEFLFEDDQRAFGG